MAKNDQYYVIHSVNNKNFPMMQASTKPKLKYLYSDKYLDDNDDIKLINNRMECQLAPEIYSYEINLAKPIPKDPRYVDFHSYDLEQSVSEKFVKAFKDFPGIQFVQGTGGEVINELKLDYYYLHYLYSIKCLDLENAKADVSFSGRIIQYKKLVLDYEVLDNIPEEQRLIFWLREDPMTCIVHQKFVDVYNEAGLEGARFVPIEKYNAKTAFM
ncbi:hypothetical protein [Marinicellulosiphila megalodicopiae]|uniref:hypothetical protein n=1 Tax=Marinicellulosiphila megalodicopiae TaxID=2724896 RepID=UPI003BB05B6A